MTRTGRVLSTVTTITFTEDKKPVVYISLSFCLEDNMIDYGFLSGYGVKWLAQILYVMGIDNLESIYDKKLVIETDNDENIVKVGCQDTGSFFGELSTNGNTAKLDQMDFERFEIGRWKK